MISIVARVMLKYHIPIGWLEVMCERCGNRCFIGPMQKEALKKLGYEQCRIICNNCEKVGADRVVLAGEILDNPVPPEHKSARG